MGLFQLQTPKYREAKGPGVTRKPWALATFGGRTGQENRGSGAVTLGFLTKGQGGVTGLAFPFPRTRDLEDTRHSPHGN